MRRIWTATRLGAGTYGWTWNGKTTAGAFVKPGTYTVVVGATSTFGPSRGLDEHDRPAALTPYTCRR